MTFLTSATQRQVATDVYSTDFLTELYPCSCHKLRLTIELQDGVLLLFLKERP